VPEGTGRKISCQSLLLLLAALNSIAFPSSQSLLAQTGHHLPTLPPRICCTRTLPCDSLQPSRWRRHAPRQEGANGRTHMVQTPKSTVTK
jgi:hypothetical protein